MMLNEAKHFLVKVLLPTVSRVRFLWALSGVILAFAVYSLISVESAEIVVRYGGYWFTFSVVVGFLYYCVCHRRVLLNWFVGLNRSVRQLLIAAWVFGGVLLFAHASFGPKVMMDDAVLESTARNLHKDRQVYVTTYGREIENQFFSFNGYVDKRPWLYPFAVSILHDMTGYRIGNAYAMNAIAGFLFLGVLLILGYQISSIRGALLLLFLWLTIPLFAQNTTGSGMDMVNLLMLSVVIITSLNYLKRPSHQSEGLLSLAGVLLAYCRYESALFCLMIFVLIIIGWVRSKRIWLSIGTVLAAPLLIGLILQQKFFSASDALWELHSGRVTPFGIEHFGENSSRALSFFFNTTDQMGNSFLVAVFGFASLFFLLFRLLKHSDQISKADPVQWTLALMSIFLLGHIAVILCYHDGALDRLFAARFALPFYMLLTCNTVLCLRTFSKAKVVWNCFFAVTVVFLLSITFPANAKAVFTHRNFVVRELEWIERILDSEAQERALIIDSFGVYWALRDRSALPQRTVMLSGARIAGEVHSGKFSEVFLVDRRELKITNEELVLMPSGFVSDVFELEILAESSFKPFQLTQIYRVSNLEPLFRGGDSGESK